MFGSEAWSLKASFKAASVGVRCARKHNQRFFFRERMWTFYC